MSYSIRRFRPDEVQLYKAIRLEALELEPGNFGNAYEPEVAYPDALWQDRLESANRACFGLFAGEELIGLTSILRNADELGEGYLTQSYIRSGYRGRGLSRMLYDARIRWAKENGLAWLVVGHRESNLASKAANQRYGFQYSHREMRQWPDGGREDMLYYRLHLSEGQEILGTVGSI